ncbi:uncharacterized protein AMSG_05985 [Thecamonas trahens ATCC 50062]|uniref:Uncharacterized protein n=1 Tax=Thecamonas trahens ATCC 50062 TaxID=461836 RepID=A0A0L0DEG4_THETB|nr:hypothetical protein AMSG_05985 [Thecamonas trahens ATCC 50062]KNC49718.1 hypothetical protein AMSG_05985 [Thecamonas trahens ATCC 50062]|eukprot:XP_013757509.1 hypothetical protein AMSG_05985 [Thecamonas trahens ATCC 50062]
MSGAKVHIKDASGGSRFKHLTFKERLARVSVDIFHVSAAELAQSAAEKPTDGVSDSFLQARLHELYDLNLTVEFKAFFRNFEPSTRSLPLVLHHAPEIIDALLEQIARHNELNMQAFVSMLVALARDVQGEFMPHLDRTIKTLLDAASAQLGIASGNVGAANILEIVFTAITFLYKFLLPYVLPRLDEQFRIIMPFLLHPAQYMADFASQTFGYLLRKVKLTKLTKTLTKLFKVVEADGTTDIGTALAFGNFVFVSVRGVDGHFHSRTTPVLGSLFAILVDAPDDAAEVFRFAVLSKTVATLAFHANKNVRLLTELWTALHGFARDSWETPVVCSRVLALIASLLEHCRGHLPANSKAVFKAALTLAVDVLERPDPTPQFNETAVALALATLEHASASILAVAAPNLRSLLFSSAVTTEILRAVALRVASYPAFVAVHKPHLITKIVDLCARHTELSPHRLAMFNTIVALQNADRALAHPHERSEPYALPDAPSDPPSRSDTHIVSSELFAIVTSSVVAALDAEDEPMLRASLAALQHVSVESPMTSRPSTKKKAKSKKKAKKKAESAGDPCLDNAISTLAGAVEAAVAAGIDASVPAAFDALGVAGAAAHTLAIVLVNAYGTGGSHADGTIPAPAADLAVACYDAGLSAIRSIGSAAMDRTKPLAPLAELFRGMNALAAVVFDARPEHASVAQLEVVLPLLIPAFASPSVVIRSASLHWASMFEQAESLDVNNPDANGEPSRTGAPVTLFNDLVQLTLLPCVQGVSMLMRELETGLNRVSSLHLHGILPQLYAHVLPAFMLGLLHTKFSPVWDMVKTRLADIALAAPPLPALDVEPDRDVVDKRNRAHFRDNIWPVFVTHFEIYAKRSSLDVLNHVTVAVTAAKQRLASHQALVSSLGKHPIWLPSFLFDMRKATAAAAWSADVLRESSIVDVDDVVVTPGTVVFRALVNIAHAFGNFAETVATPLFEQFFAFLDTDYQVIVAHKANPRFATAAAGTTDNDDGGKIDSEANDEDDDKDDNDDEDEKTLSKDAPRRSRRDPNRRIGRGSAVRQLLLYLKLIGSFRDASAFYGRERVKALSLDLVSHANAEVQLAAFEVYMLFRDPVVVPYAERIRQILDPNSFRAGITAFSPQSHAAEAHIDGLSAFLVRCLMPYLFRKLQGGGKRTRHGRRPAVLAYVGAMRPAAAQYMVARLLAPIQSLVDAFSVTDVGASHNDADAAARIVAAVEAVSFAKIQSALYLVPELVQHLSTHLEPQARELIGLAMIMARYVTIKRGMFDTETKKHARRSFQDIERAALKSLALLYDHFYAEPAEWATAVESGHPLHAEMVAFLQGSHERLAGMSEDSLDGLSMWLRFVCHTLAPSHKLARFLSVGSTRDALLDIIALRNKPSPDADHAVVSILNALAKHRLLDIFPKLARKIESKPAGQHLPWMRQWVEASDIDVAAAEAGASSRSWVSDLVQPIGSVLLERVVAILGEASNKLTKMATEFILVLVDFADLVASSASSAKIYIDRVTPFLHSTAKTFVQVAAPLTRVLRILAPTIEHNMDETMWSLGVVFGRMPDATASTARANVLAAMRTWAAAGLVSNSEVVGAALKRLAALQAVTKNSQGQLEPDFEVRLAGYDALSQPDVVVSLSTAVALRALLHQALADLRGSTWTDRGLSQAGYFFVKAVIKAGVSADAPLVEAWLERDDAPAKLRLVHVIRDTVGQSLLAIIRTPPSPAVSDLAVRLIRAYVRRSDKFLSGAAMLTSDDSEKDVLLGLAATAMWRVKAAIARIDEMADELPSHVAVELVIPLLRPHIMVGSEEGAKAGVADSASQLRATLVSKLNWAGYLAQLNAAIKDVDAHIEIRRRLVEVVVRQLEHFKFDLVANEAQRSVVVDSILPRLYAMLMDSGRASGTVRTNVANIIVYLLRCLPRSDMEAALPQLIIRVVNQLKHHESKHRDRARKTLIVIALALGPDYFRYIVREMRATLQRGMQRHVLAFTATQILGILARATEDEDVAAEGEDDAARPSKRSKLGSGKAKTRALGGAAAGRTRQRKTRSSSPGSSESGSSSDSGSDSGSSSASGSSSDSDAGSDSLEDEDMLSSMRPLIAKDTRFTEGSIDYCMGEIVEMLLESEFGSVAEEKEIGALTRKSIEARFRGGSKAFEYIGRLVSLGDGTWQDDVVGKMRAKLGELRSRRKADHISKCMRYLARGVAGNNSFEPLAVLSFLFRLGEEELAMERKNEQDRKKKRSSLASTSMMEAEVSNKAAVLAAQEAARKRFLIEPEPNRRRGDGVAVNDSGRSRVFTPGNQPMMVHFVLYTVLNLMNSGLLEVETLDDLQRLDPFVKVFVKAMSNKSTDVRRVALTGMRRLLRLARSDQATAVLAEAIDASEVGDEEEVGANETSEHDAAEHRQRVRVLIALPSLDRAFPNLLRKAAEVIMGAGPKEGVAVAAALQLMAEVVALQTKSRMSAKQLEVIVSLIRESVLTRAGGTRKTEDKIAAKTRRFAAMRLLDVVLSNRYVSPSLYDLMTPLSQLMVKTQSQAVSSRVSKILGSFLMYYPLGAKLLERHVSFFLKNLGFDFESGRRALLVMLQKVIRQFPGDVINKLGSLMFLPLAARLINEPSRATMPLVGSVVELLLERLDAANLQRVFSYAETWCGQTEKRESLGRLGFQIFGMLANRVGAEAFISREKGKWWKSFVAAVDAFVPAVDDDAAASNLVADWMLDSWQVVYQLLHAVFKIVRGVPYSRSHVHNSAMVGRMWQLAVELLMASSHSWVRLQCMQLVGVYFARAREVGHKAGTASLVMLSSHDALRKLAKVHIVQIDTPGQLVSDPFAHQLIKNLLFIIKWESSLESPPQRGMPVTTWILKRVSWSARTEQGEGRRSTAVRTFALKLFAAFLGEYPLLEDSVGEDVRILAVGGSSYAGEVKPADEERVVAWIDEIKQAMATTKTHTSGAGDDDESDDESEPGAGSSADTSELIPAEYLAPMLHAMYNMVEAKRQVYKSRKHTEEEREAVADMVDLVHEVLKFFKQRTGTLRYTRVWAAVREHITGVRSERREKMAHLAETLPEVVARRRRASDKRSRKRKRVRKPKDDDGEYTTEINTKLYKKRKFHD